MRYISGSAKLALVSAVFIACAIVLYHNHDYIFRQSITIRQMEFPSSQPSGQPPKEGARATGRTKVPKQPRQPVALNGTYEVISNTETVWQLPPTKLLGVWFLAHGCSHGAIDFWPKGPGCKDCIGLPEEVNITRELLSRGYAVIAISSQDREASQCWVSGGYRTAAGGANVDRGPDIRAVTTVLKQWLATQGLQPLPLYALGASSGGEFVLQLAMGAVKLSGVVSQIMAVPPSELSRYMAAVKESQGKADQQAPGQPPPLPHILFIHMLRDKFTASTVKECLAALKSLGVRSAEMPLHPTPLTPDTLHNAASDEFTESQSEAVYKALKSQGFLTPDDQLTTDPRLSAWREALVTAKVPGVDAMRLQPDLSPLSEILNVLYCSHEIVSRTTTDMLDWFEASL